MAIGDNIGLLFRIKAKNETKDEFRQVKGDVQGLSGATAGLGGSMAALVNPVTLAAGAIAAIGTAAVATVTGLFNLAQGASEFGSQIFDATEKTGLAAETISSLKFAADQSGSSIETFTKGLALFAKTVGQAAEGSEEAKKKLEDLGITPQEALNDLDGALAKVFQRISEAKPGIEQITLAQKAFGRSGADLLPTIKSFDGDMAGLIKRAKELGVVLTDEDARAADEFGDQLDTLKSQAQGVAFQFAREFMPTITGAMSSISSAFANNKDVVSEWGKTVNNILQGYITYLQFLGRVTDGIFNAIGAGLLTLEQKVKILVASFSPLLAILNEIGDRFGVKGAGLGNIAQPLTTGQTFDFTDDSAQKKAADDRKRREQEEIAARQKFLTASKERIQQAFDELQAITRKNYEDRLIDAAKFQEDFEENERQFRVRMIELAEASFKIQTEQAKNNTEREAIEIEKRTAIEKIISDSDKRINDAQKFITDTQKKNSAERIRIAEEEVNRKIAAAEAFVDKQIALIEAEDVAESEKIARRSVIEAALLAAKRRAYEKLLEAVKGYADKEADIQIKLDSLDAEMTRNKTGNSKTRTEALEKEKEAIEALHRAEFERRQGSMHAENEDRSSVGEDAGGGGFLGQMRQLLGLGEQLPILASMFTDFANIVGGAFRGLAQAIGSVVEQWILTGETAPAVMRKILASALASIAAESAVRAVFELAMGFASLFFNPAEAAAHFKAAALFGSIAVGAAVTGRAVAGDAFRQQTNAATGGGGSGSNASPGETRFTTEFGGYGTEQNRLKALIERQNTVLGQVEETLHQFNRKVTTMPAGEVVAIGASDASREIRHAYESELQDNVTATDRLMRGTGLAR